MAGVVAQFGAFEAAKRAVAAGNDVLLMPSDIRGTIDAVVAGVHEGRYSEERLNSSVKRLLLLKAGFGLHRNRLVSIDSVRTIVGDSTHVALANLIAERGIVLAKDSLLLVPLVAGDRRPRVLSLTYARRADLGAGTTFNAELRRSGAAVTPVYVSADDPEPNVDTVIASVDSVDLVVVGSYVNISSTTTTASAPSALPSLLTQIGARTRNIILVSFGTPYLLQQAPDVSAYVLAWGGMPATQRAAARALLGEIPISARLPVSIPPLLPLGAGESRPGRRSSPP